MPQTLAFPTPVSGIPTGFISQIYGPGGTDLTVLTATNPTLTKDTYVTNCTIQGTGNLKPNGWKLFVSGTLTISADGSINDDGLPASGTSGGVGLTARNSVGGQSGSGGNGYINTITNGATGGAVVTSSSNNSGLLPFGGAGGASFTGAQVGGAGGTATTGTQSIWGSWQSGRTAGATTFTGGGGGGSGSCSSTTLATSGGGGSGGGGVYIAAKNIVNLGRISANGGNGAAAVGTNNASGGGGGGGGFVIIVTDTVASAVGTIRANGGSGGAAIGTSLPGYNGTPGAMCIVSFGGN